MQLVDTHCHLYLSEFKNDLPDVILRAQSVGVNKFYLPAIDSSVMNDLVAIEAEYSGKCFAMAGLHPCSVGANYMQELHQTAKFLKNIFFVAIGEIGLDFYWSTKYEKEQYEAFEIQMNWALQYNLPIVIHTRSAMQQTIDFVKPFAAKGLRGIFHCFGDSYEHAGQVLDLGFYLGIGGVLTFKKSGLDEVVKKIDLRHLVLETDAPYLAPVPFRGKRNESSYIKIIAEKLAFVKNIALEEVAAVTTANAEIIFGR
jgi:TatD DNase family protein